MLDSLGDKMHRSRSTMASLLALAAGAVGEAPCSSNAASNAASNGVSNAASIAASIAASNGASNAASIAASIAASNGASNATSNAASNATSTATVQWIPCPRGLPEGLDCGEIIVPLTYKSGSSIEPADDRTIVLGLTRRNATGDRDSIRGPLFINPGGPGGDTRYPIVSSFDNPLEAFNDDVMEMYDIVGLDPRGVGASTPVKCDPEIYNRRVRMLVNDTESYNAVLQYGKDLGESCADLTGPLIDYLDTIHVAKDHELVRRALGADQFDFLGLSYGSMIGTTFLELFPLAAGRLALDAIVDHSQSEVSTVFAEATTFEATLEQWFKWCDGQDDCAVNADSNDTKTVFQELAYNASLSPIPAPGCDNRCQPNVTFEDLMKSVTENLADFPDGWRALSEGLATAVLGNASALSAKIMTSEISDQDGFSAYAGLAVGCQDWTHRASTEQDIIQRLASVQPFSPITKGVTQILSYQTFCLGWPTNTTFPQQPLNKSMVDKAPPVLLVNSVYDPECSLVWANGVREQLPSAVSITRNGAGHSSHGMQGDTRDAMDTFLATGILPSDGTVYQS